MSNFERKQRIMNILYQKQSITIDELLQLLNVSPATIRRDVKELAEKGLVIRYPGGISLPTFSFGYEPSLKERESKNLKAKYAIAQEAVKLIKEGEVIGIDIGTTTLEFAKALISYQVQNITVFTFSIPIAYTLAHSNLKVFLTGGQINPKELSLSGPIVREIIKQYHFDKFFLGAAGITEEAGISDFDIDAIEIKKLFIKNSREVILLTDSSKFGKTSFKTICGFEEINKIITDEKIEPIYLKLLKKKGVETIIVHLE
ncbi:MAG: DeoR/GlpR transcriptional regulator [Thermoanaerobacter sp.]|nr:DeoR/GlpR transcriptional regulator [Thermoanaerobacter sp.]